MASSSIFSHNAFSCTRPFHQNSRSNQPLLHLKQLGKLTVKATAEAENKEKLTQTKTKDSSNAQPSTPAAKPPKKPVYSMKKGQIVSVDKEKYLNSINYLSVGHPPYYKGLDYIYEDRGEVTDMHLIASHNVMTPM